jgi:hypothetical protein
LIDGEDLDVRSGFLFSAGPDAFKALWFIPSYVYTNTLCLSFTSGPHVRVHHVVICITAFR